MDLVTGALAGLRIFAASYAADMREFGFSRAHGNGDAEEGEWYLHIQCPWRFESGDAIVTGSFDWFEPADTSQQLTANWNPAAGGSLQDQRLREVFQDHDKGLVIRNHTEHFVVLGSTVNSFGDLTIDLSGGYRLRVLPTGSRGEFWRFFKKGDLTSHFVCDKEF